MVGSQGIEHVVYDLLDGVRDGGQRRQFQRSCLYQLHRIWPFNSKVFKLIIRSCGMRVWGLACISHIKHNFTRFRACTLTRASAARRRQGDADTIAGSFSKTFRVTTGRRAKDTQDIVDFPGAKAARHHS